RASGVAYVDKTTGSDRHVRARVVVLAASALETARLLLNSRSSAFPNGLANGSGTAGKYITDTTGTDVAGFIPKMMDHVPHNHDGYCEIDPRTVDRWGIPVLRFHWKWSDHEYKQVKHMQETFRALIAAMGGEVFSPMPGPERGYGIAAGGVIIHELGGARMGDDPKTSVTNRWCQAHECKNLFVSDGAPFVSQADKNPTWTILALALRTSEHITELIKRGEL